MQKFSPNNRSSRFLSLCVALSITSFGCDEPETTDQSIRSALNQIGFDGDSAIVYESTVLVEGDLVFSIDWVLNQQASIRSDNQFRARFIRPCKDLDRFDDPGCAPAPPNVLTVFADDSCPDDLKVAVQEAVEDWAEVGAPIGMAASEQAASGVVSYSALDPRTNSTLPNGVLAAAEFTQTDSFTSEIDASINPSGKLRISVNPNFQNPAGDQGYCDITQPDKQRTLLTHEIGHWLGFTHHDTNQGIHIPGTDDGQELSIMDTYCNFTPATIQPDDIAGLMRAYPDAEPPVGGSDDGGADDTGADDGDDGGADDGGADDGGADDGGADDGGADDGGADDTGSTPSDDDGASDDAADDGGAATSGATLPGGTGEESDPDDQGCSCSSSGDERGPSGLMLSLLLGGLLRRKRSSRSSTT